MDRGLAESELGRVIAALDRLGHGMPLGKEEARLLRSFGAAAAEALAATGPTATPASEEQLHSISVSERERRRWARELHDDTLQGLGALRVMLSAAARRGSDEELRFAVRRAIEELATEISKLRSLIAELRPVALDELGLAAALESLVARQAPILGADIDAEISLRYGGERQLRLHPEVETAVYRAVQEALSNIAKHARAEHVDLRVVETADAIEVEVGDDGVGFDSASSSDGFGLIGMKERVALVGGALSISSAPGSGTTLEMSVPVVLRGEEQPGPE